MATQSTWGVSALGLNPRSMKFFITVASLLALAECRRHLCDDGAAPICPDGSRAVYNRPTGKNTDGTSYFPPPICNGEGSPACADGSEAKARFNSCTKEEMKCPNGQGFGPFDKPFPACADGSKCHCPGGGKNCQFRYKVCDNGQHCRTRCRAGEPHCPWATKNRNPHNGVRDHNAGANRPGNKGHNWGP